MDWIVELRNPLWTQVFLAFSAMGSATFFLVVFTLGYWLVDRAVFLRVTFVLLLVGLANNVAKAVFQVPRPDESLRIAHAAGWSFPSGHAMTAGAVWPWLAREVGRLWTWFLAAMVVTGVAASRVYLGVHTPVDVIVGVVAGLACSIVLWPLAEMAPAVWQRLEGHQRFAVAVIPVVLLLYVLPENGDSTAAQTGGGLVGLILGADLERRRVRFRPARGWKRVLGVLVVGLGGIFALRAGLEVGLASIGWDGRWADALRYALVAFFFACAAPWLFVRAGWCETGDAPTEGSADAR